METYIEVDPLNSGKDIWKIREELCAAIDEVLEVHACSGANKPIEGLIIVSGGVIPQNTIREKVAGCGLAFVEGSYRDDTRL